MNYAIILNDRQLNIYRNALEFYSRFLAGQTDYLPPLLDWNLDIDYNDKKKACDMFKKVLFPKLQTNESYGIGIEKDDKLSEERTISYEMYKEVYIEQRRQQREKGTATSYSVHDRKALHLSDEPVSLVIPCIDIEKD